MSRVSNGTNQTLFKSAEDLGITAFPFSIVTWIRHTTSTNGDVIFYFQNDSVTTHQFIGKDKGNANALASAVQSATVNTGTTDAQTVDTWVPYIFTYDTNLTSVQGLTDVEEMTDAITFSTNNAPTIRLLGQIASGNVVNAKMACFVVYNAILSAGDKADIIAGVSPFVTGVADQTRAWDFRDGTGDADLVDTITGTVTLTNSSTTTDDSDNPTFTGELAAKTVTIPTIVNGESLTGLSFIVLDIQELNTAAIIHQGLGEVTDALGNLEIDLATTSVLDADPLIVITGDWGAETPTVDNIAAVCIANAVVT